MIMKYLVLFLAIYCQFVISLSIERETKDVKEVKELKEKKKPDTKSTYCYAPYISYIVKPGDTCDNLKYKYTIASSSLYLCGTYLQVGATLCVEPIYNTYEPSYYPAPAPYYPPTCYSPYTAYTVQYGDTCDSLKYKYVISSQSQYMCGTTLQVGAILCVEPIYNSYPAPYYPPTCYSPFMAYTVQAGDTCNYLQQKYIISSSSLYLCGTHLQVGTVLCVQAKYYNPLPYNPTPYYPPAPYNPPVQYNPPAYPSGYPTTYPFICNLYSLCPSGSAPYIIKNADTCSALAANRGYSVETLIYKNPGLNCYPDYLASYAGQCLCF